ncbi:ABC transporter permease [Candidatus Kaiserbacteria bacterium]|nr:ABC transporter permease [Candidatus Kaiserbacteria bacterium]
MTHMDSRRIWIAYTTIFLKECGKIFRIPFQTLVTPIVSVLLFFLVVGGILGEKIGTIQGVPFIEFVIPGVILLAVMINTFVHVAKNLFSARVVWNNISEMLVAPIPPWVIVVGFASAGVVRGLLVGCVVLLVSLFLSPLSIVHPFTALFFFVLTSICFAFIGIIAGLCSTSLENISMVNVFVITPAIYIGGVYHSITYLSPWAATASEWNPTFYLINGFRYGVLGVSDAGISLSLLVLVGAATLSIAGAVYLSQRGVGLTR